MGAISLHWRVTIDQKNRKRRMNMKTYKCEEMMCDGCVKRIKNGLSAEGIGHEVDLSAKTVKVEGDEAVQAKAVEILDDLGFTTAEV